jgi:hypothetical protein
MTVVIAIPVFRVGCKVGIDRGRAWSVIDEVVLWMIARQSKTVAELSSQADLPHQLIIASIARLMRFRLIEVDPSGTVMAFRASSYGFKAVSGGHPLHISQRELRDASVLSLSGRLAISFQRGKHRGFCLPIDLIKSARQALKFE